MVKTESTMLPLGTKAPAFSLRSVNGQMVSLDDVKEAKALVVVFMCNHCPFVIHIADQLSQFARDYAEQGAVVIGINSNDTSAHPQDSPEQMVHEAEGRGYIFPYLFDEDQSVAKAYRAACTPDFFIFDGQQQLVYRGQFDSSRPGNETPVTGSDVRAAVDQVLAGESLSAKQIPSLGCNIKWKPGNAPEYFNPAGI